MLKELHRHGIFCVQKYGLSERKQIMEFTYRPRGVCSQQMEIETEGNIIKNVRIIGGCSGNGQGVARLVQGMDLDTAIEKMDGIRCGFKSTSCPDQLAQALKQIKAKTEQEA